MSASRFWTRLRHAFDNYPQTAREWAVRVQSSDVTRDELLALDRWLKADPSNADAYARVNKISHMGQRLSDYPDLLAQLRGVAEPVGGARPSVPTNSRFPWVRPVAILFTQPLRPFAAAACMALIIASGWWVAPEATRESMRGATVYRTAHGEQRQIALADGSRVFLNSASQVSMRLGNKDRKARLLKGEAYFEVAKDVTRPFLVATDSADIRVVGTKFSVRREALSTTVVVTEGQVDVTPRTTQRAQIGGSAVATMVATQKLTPGKRIDISPEVQPRIEAINAERAVAWTSGNIEFDETLLGEVIDEINRYTAKPFVLDDPSLMQLRVTGRFRVGDVESVKFALQDRFRIYAMDNEKDIRLAR
jgi:transmembrane sensor